MRNLTLGAALAALLMVLFGGTAAAQDREEPRRSVRTGFSGIYFTHTVREGENLTTPDAYDGPGGLIHHYFGHRRDGLIAELRRYDTNWRTIREWCHWPEDVARADRTAECPQEHLRYSVRRSVGRTIFIPLSLIEREARRDRSPGYRELEPRERVTHHLRQLAAADPGFRRQLETLGTAHAAFVAAGTAELPEVSADRQALATANARIGELETQIRRVRREARDETRNLREENARLRRQVAERWEPEMAYAGMAGTGFGGMALVGIPVGIGFVISRRRRKKDGTDEDEDEDEEKANTSGGPFRTSQGESRSEIENAPTEVPVVQPLVLMAGTIEVKHTVEPQTTELEKERGLRRKSDEAVIAERREKDEAVRKLGDAQHEKAEALAAKEAAEVALRRIGTKLGAHSLDAETVEDRAALVWDFSTHAALAFGVMVGDIPAIQKETQAYAQMKVAQVGIQANLAQAERELEEERRKIERLEDELAGKVFDDLGEFGGNGGTYRPAGTVMKTLDDIAAEAKKAGESGSLPPLQPQETRPGIAIPGESVSDAVQAQPPAGRERKTTETFGLVPEGETAKPEDKILCGCGRGIKRKNWRRHRGKCPDANASDIEAEARDSEE